MDTLIVQRKRTQELLLAFVPAVYFMLLGMFNIGMDLWHNTFRGLPSLGNLIFFIPIIFRRRRIYLVCGICFSLLFLYFLFASLFVVPGNTRITPLEAWAVEFWLLFSFACSLSLWYVGTRKFR